MSWSPLGPTIVISAKNLSYTRMARENEVGCQAAILDIAIHPLDQTNIVAVVRRVGGTSAFHSTDDGHSWTPISDVLTQANPQLDISSAAFHPTLPNVIFLGARAGQQVFVSNDGGQTWPLQADPGGQVTKLVVDRSSDPADASQAFVYAATNSGVAWSSDGGASWSMAGANGEVTSLAVYMPLSGDRQFYAGVYGAGLFYYDGTFGASLFPAGGATWQNLLGNAPGLPAPSSLAANFTVYVDYSPRQPTVVYAFIAQLYSDHANWESSQLYVSSSAPPSGSWTQAAGTQPPVDSNLEGVSFMAVSPANGTASAADVLFASAGVFLQRSTNVGLSWDLGDQQQLLHSDTRSLAQYPPKTAFYPDTLASGTLSPQSRVYVGCDGGLAASIGYSEPSFSFDAPSDIDFNAGSAYDPTEGLVQSLNHGLAAVAAYQFASNPAPMSGGPMSLAGYCTALDTGTSRRVGSPAWADVAGGDSGLIFVAPTGNGIQVWSNDSADIIWPVWNLISYVDQDPFEGGSSFAHVATPGAPSCELTSNPVPAPSPANFYAGILALEQVTTLAQVVNPGSAVTIYPVTMTPDFVLGARVCLGDPALDVYQPITQVNADNFVATIFPPQSGPNYPIGTAVRVVRTWVGRVTDDSAAPISQAFLPQGKRMYRLAQSGDNLLAASADQKLWSVAGASAAGPSTVWTQVANTPTVLNGATVDDPNDGIEAGEFESGVQVQLGNKPLIAGIAADAGGTFYVMLSAPDPATNTPLFSIQAGAWTAENCTQPANAAIPVGVALGKLIADPGVAGRLYVSRNARIFQLDKSASGWTWTDLTDNLPGQEIHDLWFGNIAPVGAATRTVLRALTAVRGLWEIELGGPAATDPQLYFRDHAFDPGWLGPSVDGIVSPLNSTETCWHWQSPDILVDTPLEDKNSNLYYQNDPQAPTPTAGDYAWFKDRSQGAAAGQTARIWVRVNNRSVNASGLVNVWVITAPYSGGLPALPSGFWPRFQSNGSIDTSSFTGAWTSLGVQTVTARAEEPGIAGFQMPTGSQGDHRCIVAFVHGPGAALLDTTGLNQVVDDVVPARPQIAQRNVFVGAPLPPGPDSPLPSGPFGPVGEIVILPIEFHNPGNKLAEYTVRFNLAAIPKTASFEFRLTKNATPRAIKGARPLRVRPTPQKSGRKRAKRKPARSAIGKLALRATVHASAGGGIVEAQRVKVKPQSNFAAELTLRFPGPRRAGEVYRVDILQLSKGKVAGGATILVPVAGRRATPKQTQVDWDVERATADRLTGRSR